MLLVHDNYNKLNHIVKCYICGTTSLHKFYNIFSWIFLFRQGLKFTVNKDVTLTLCFYHYSKSATLFCDWTHKEIVHVQGKQ